jgi:hypothetical protein
VSSLDAKLWRAVMTAAISAMVSATKKGSSGMAA